MRAASSRWDKLVKFHDGGVRKHARSKETLKETTGQNRSKMSLLAIVMGGSWVTFVLSMCLTTIVMILLVRRGKFLYALRRVPYPPAFPIIGNAHQLCCSPEGKRNIFWRERKESVLSLRLEISEFLFVSNLKKNNTLKYSNTLVIVFIIIPLKYSNTLLHFCM